MNKGANGVVTFECADKDSGPKLLSLKGDSASPVPSPPSATASSSTPTKDNSKPGSTATTVPSTSSQKTTSKTDSSDKTKSTKAEEPSSGVLMGSVGSQFIIHDKGGGLYTIEVVGVDKSAKYVDGSKNDGTVGLGVAGNKGTTWKKETDSSGNIRFKCADCTGSKVYLDGQQSDGAWAVGLGIKGNSGTEWKMVPQPDGRYSLECVDKKSGPQYLSMVSNGKTVTPTVPYDPKPATSTNQATTLKGSDTKNVVSAPKAPDTSNVATKPVAAAASNVAKPLPITNTVVTKNGSGTNDLAGGVTLPAANTASTANTSTTSKLPIVTAFDWLMDGFKALFLIGNTPDAIVGGSGAIDKTTNVVDKIITPQLSKSESLTSQASQASSKAAEEKAIDEGDAAAIKLGQQNQKLLFGGN